MLHNNYITQFFLAELLYKKNLNISIKKLWVWVRLDIVYFVKTENIVAK